MHLRSLTLRNYRVYRSVDLEFPDGLIGIYGANGSGKCLPAHVRIYDADAGGMVPIRQFVLEHRKHTLGLRNGRIERVPVIDWMALGERPTIEVTLRNGARIEVAETHPVLTDRGCIQAKDLTTEHWVAEAAVIPALGPPQMMVDEAMLLGLLLGDGSLSSTGITLTAGDEAIGDLFRQLVERLFPGATIGSIANAKTSARTLYVRSQIDGPRRKALFREILQRLHHLGVPLERFVSGGNLVGVRRGDQGLAWETLCAIEEEYGIDLFAERSVLYPARALRCWIMDLGLLGATSGSKHVPPDLLTMPDEQTWALLAGLWLTDGWFSISGDATNVAYCTKSRQLAEDVRQLLRRVGVRSSTQRRTVRGSLYWNVVIALGSYQQLRHMPLVGVKAERRDRILALPRSPRRGNSGDLIPSSFNSQITLWRSPTGDSRTADHRHHAMNRPTFRDFVRRRSVADEETIWSRVVAVRTTGRSLSCYDIEVDTDEHLYLAESFIVHNSTLIESLRFALYGDSRTDKWELRTAGVGDDVRVELVFEHEGNTFDVRRRLKGRNLTPEVEVFLNGQLAAQSVREANAYLARVVGMDQRAFLASVCAQQKELTAFATMVPGDRRKLVLDLLGVSPVERALAKVREQGRDARTTATGARAGLPDLAELEAAAAAAAGERQRAEEAEQAAAAAEADAAATLAAAEQATAAAEQAAKALEELRAKAGLARAAADGHREEAERHEARAAEADRLGPEIKAAAARVAELAAAAAPLEALEQARERAAARANLVTALEEARARQRTSERALRKAEADAEGAAGLVAARVEAEETLTGLDEQLASARDRHAQLSEAAGAAANRLEAATRAGSAAADLDPDAPCPTCGQPLGAAHAELRRRHDQELAAATAAHAAATEARRQAIAAGKALAERRAALAAILDQARAAETKAAKATALVEAAGAALEQNLADVAARQQALDQAPDPGFDPDAWALARQAAQAGQEAALHLAGLERRVAQADAERGLAKQALARADQADARAAALDAEAAALGPADAVLAEARERQKAAASAATAAHGARSAAAQARAGAGRLAEAHQAALEAGRAQHDRVAGLEEQAAYLQRLADLVAGFRLHLVSRLGRRLSVESAALFAELTDHEYQDLVVDPENYAIRIADAGTEYELSRFSGSENDLASLSLRVAVSLVIAESAGELGLLVLDEVLGALDRERRERMLEALTRLQGRFRQVLLVTHNDEVKDLLPAAIEVRRRPDRTSVATLQG
jgi:DNA repair exonuclease SbcCD ATPase subunit/intein/homing endonuclease